MSTSIQALRERRAAVALNARQILDENTGDKWTVQLGEKVDALYGEIAAIDNRISTEERAIQIESADKVEHFHAADHDPMSSKVLFNKWMRGGDNSLNAAEWTHIRNTMSTTTNSEGGFTMPSLTWLCRVGTSSCATFPTKRNGMSSGRSCWIAASMNA